MKVWLTMYGPPPGRGGRYWSMSFWHELKARDDDQAIETLLQEHPGIDRLVLVLSDKSEIHYEREGE